ncbi:MAG: hypothetical protein AAF546_11015 [Verrucomicrobiota bacterium]
MVQKSITAETLPMPRCNQSSIPECKKGLIKRAGSAALSENYSNHDFILIT